MNPRDDADLYPQLLYDRMLGSPYGGPGLLRRVEAIVAQQASGDGPSYRTGSIIPTGSMPSDSSRESGFSERTFELLVAIVQWMGAGIRDDPQTQKGLLEYLMRHKLADVDLLLGPTGRLTQARSRVHDLLGEVTQAHLERVQELSGFLNEWIGDDCPHTWQEVESVTGTGSVYRCANRDCGLLRYEGKDGHWLAV